MSDRRLSVVIAARNEDQTIEDAVRGARGHAAEVIVVDGRSTDETRARAEQAGARVVEDGGRGKGEAVRRGLDAALGEVVVLMDADGSHDPADIPRLAEPVLAGRADLVVGSRFAGGSEELSVNLEQLVRTIGNISMNVAINRRFGVYLTDTLNGFRAIRRAFVPALGLRENRHTIEQEMVIRALHRGLRVMNVPTHEFPRRFGRSHIRIRREWPIFVWCVFRNLLRG